MPLDENAEQVEKCVVVCTLTLLRILAHLHRKDENPNQGLGLGYDLLTSRSVHAEVLPCNVCLPTLVLLAQAIFPFRANRNHRLVFGLRFDLRASVCQNSAMH